MSSVPVPAPSATPAGEDAAYYRRVLHELIDLGAALARVVVGRATAAEPPANAAAASDAFERVARAVRRTVRLAEYLASPRPAVRSPAQLAVTNRRRVLRGVEDMIQDEASGSEAVRMRAELLERLESPDLDDELLDRPIEDVIRTIRCDLGLPALAGATRWKPRSPADVAEMERLAVNASTRTPPPSSSPALGGGGGGEADGGGHKRPPSAPGPAPMLRMIPSPAKQRDGIHTS